MTLHELFYMTGRVSYDPSWMFRSLIIVHAAFYRLSKGFWYLLVSHQMTEVTAPNLETVSCKSNPNHASSEKSILPAVPTFLHLDINDNFLK